MLKVNSDLMKGLDLFASRQQAFAQNDQTAMASYQASSDSVQVEKSEQQSFIFFYRSVQNRLEQNLESKQSKLEKEFSERQIQQQEARADKAASSILNFIEHQLNQDVKDGASLIALESRLEAALKGFNQGYQEATDTLEEMDLLSENVKSETALTQNKVLAGIEQLKQKFLNTEPTSAEESSTDDVTTGTESFSAKASAAQMNDFSFDLTTADGDKITITSSAIQAYSVKNGYTEYGSPANATRMAYQTSSAYQESNFSFSVEGELDENELAAINNLLNNVNDLATDFYSGDVHTAFEKALELNYDANEISAFSISLTQIKNFTAYQAYQTDKPLFNPSVINDLKPLAEFSNQLRHSFDSLKTLFAEPKSLMSNVMSGINLLQKPDEYSVEQTDFLAFANELLNKFEQLSSIE